MHFTQLSAELINIKSWIQYNKLKLNISKSNYILIQNKPNKNVIPTLLLHGEQLKQVNQTKFLGVRIDENLNWRYHIDDVCLKL